MRISIITAGLLAALLAGCTTAEEVRAADEEKCRAEGFRKNTIGFDECLRQRALVREARLRDPSWLILQHTPVHVPHR